MSTATIRLNSDLIKIAEVKGKAEYRKPSQQIEYWTKIARCGIDNPDLSFSEIRSILEGLVEAESGMTEEYKFG